MRPFLEAREGIIYASEIQVRYAQVEQRGEREKGKQRRLWSCQRQAHAATIAKKRGVRNKENIPESYRRVRHVKGAR